MEGLHTVGRNPTVMTGDSWWQQPVFIGHLYPLSILVLGLLLSSVHIIHFLVHDKPLGAQIIGTLLPLGLALAVSLAGYISYTNQHIRPWSSIQALWTFIGCVGMTSLVSLIVIHQYSAGTPLDDAAFLLAIGGTGGALAGYGIGFYETQYRRKAERIETIHGATQRLMASETRSEVCETVVAIVAEAFDMRLVGVWLYDENEKVLAPAASTPEADALFEEKPVFEPGNSISWQVYEESEPRLLSDVQSNPDRYNPNSPIRSELIVPLGTHGVFIIGSLQSDAFDDVDVTTAKILASTTTASLERADREEALREQRETLQTKTSQLEEFAKTVSHDLRNPLNAATLRLDLARETADLSHIEDTQNALARMETIVDDLLWLSLEGEQIRDRVTVDVESAAREAWSFIESGDGTLECDCDGFVCADEARVQQLFENLLSNAISHGGPDVRVTVGTMTDGFYVADSGPGIPTEDLESIFEAGYSTSDDGTGYGLSIVETIVEAHDWELEVTSSATGGARFDITGVEFVEENCCS